MIAPYVLAPQRRLQRRPRRVIQRGLSLVELMVGIAVGLFVVAAATTLVANQLGDNRRLLLETQVQQDLRSAMDIVTRQLRRAGAAPPTTVMAAMAASPVMGGASNPFGSIPLTTGTASQVEFSFYLDDDEQGPFGFKRENGVIKAQMRGTGGAVAPQWQDLTDPNTLKVTSFSITPRTVTSAPLPCPNLCPIASASVDPTGTRQYCWPRLSVRSYIVNIRAEAKTDPGVRRALQNEVRVRNDNVDFNDTTAPNRVCPS